MRKILILGLLVCFAIINHTFAQAILIGKVKNPSGSGIPFVNIGIKGSKIGTVTDNAGNFRIEIADSLRTQDLSFSSIGYQDHSYSIAKLLATKSIAVILQEKIISLPEIKVNNTKRKMYKLGITGRTPMVSIPAKSYQTNDMMEQARLIYLKKPAQIINANIFVLSNSLKEASIRLNFYAVENGMPGKRLIEKTIIKKGIIQKGWFTIDLKDEAIYLDQDFVVSFEYLPNGQGTVSFSAKLGASDSFLRSSSLGLWRKNELGGATLYVTAEM